MRFKSFFASSRFQNAFFENSQLAFVIITVIFLIATFLTLTVDTTNNVGKNCGFCAEIYGYKCETFTESASARLSIVFKVGLYLPDSIRFTVRRSISRRAAKSA